MFCSAISLQGRDRKAISDFVVKKDPGGPGAVATVFLAGSKIAEIRKEDQGYRLVRLGDGQEEWLLSNRVHGEPRPFSFSVRRVTAKKDGGANRPPSNGDDEEEEEGEVFVVRDQLFKHNGKFYMLANQPAGRHWSEHMLSPVRYIGRLDGFPYSELAEVDYQDRDLRDKIKRLRGTPVGEASGLGIEESGHRVRLDRELEDVGLFIAAISYLLYASA
jgi:hypothetical protein